METNIERPIRRNKENKANVGLRKIKIFIIKEQTKK